MAQPHDNESGGAGRGTGLPVLVGLDGSDHAAAAAVWAAQEALRRGVPLRLAAIVAAEAATPAVGAANDPLWDAGVERALDLLAETQAAIGTVHPELVIEKDMVAGDPVRELSAMAGHCGLLVVGSRGRGGFAGLALGSVSLHLAATLRRPLVVVPQGHAAAGHDGPTVVGLGERECPALLHYALEHAVRGGKVLRAVHAWMPYPAYASADYISDTDITARRAGERAVGWLEAAHAAGYGLKTETRVLRGRPGEVLVEQSADADLLVLGAHRRRLPLSGAIGHVLHHTVQHARCPVAIIPEQ